MRFGLCSCVFCRELFVVHGHVLTRRWTECGGPRQFCFRESLTAASVSLFVMPQQWAPFRLAFGASDVASKVAAELSHPLSQFE